MYSFAYLVYLVINLFVYINICCSSSPAPGVGALVSCGGAPLKLSAKASDATGLSSRSRAKKCRDLRAETASDTVENGRLFGQLHPDPFKRSQAPCPATLRAAVAVPAEAAAGEPRPEN